MLKSKLAFLVGMLILWTGIYQSVVAGTDTSSSEQGEEIFLPERVELEKTVYFVSPDGEPVEVPPGPYMLETADEGLRLVPFGEGEDFLVKVKVTTQGETLSELATESTMLEDDSHYLALLLPDGRTFEAIGSYSGVRARGSLGDIFKKLQHKIEDVRKQQQQQQEEIRKQAIEDRKAQEREKERIARLRESRKKRAEQRGREKEAICLSHKTKDVNVKTKRMRNCKETKKTGACKIWDPPLSDICASMSKSLVDIRYDFFGQSDCRSSPKGKRARIERKVTMIVIHNGDHAKGNRNNWWCRKSSAHYTINRDGQVYQHIGEERIAHHVVGANDDSIGIELQILRNGERGKYFATCNGLSKGSRLLKRLAKKHKVSEGDYVKSLCAPTAVQYLSLRRLLADIQQRYRIPNSRIFGHCEVGTRKSSHSDPKAFDWMKIGISNKEKLEYVKKHNRTRCQFYDLY